MTGDVARRGAIWCGARNHCSTLFDGAVVLVAMHTFS